MVRWRARGCPERRAARPLPMGVLAALNGGTKTYKVPLTVT